MCKMNTILPGFISMPIGWYTIESFIGPFCSGDLLLLIWITPKLKTTIFYFHHKSASWVGLSLNVTSSGTGQRGAEESASKKTHSMASKLMFDFGKQLSWWLKTSVFLHMALSMWSSLSYSTMASFQALTSWERGSQVETMSLFMIQPYKLQCHSLIFY